MGTVERRLLSRGIVGSYIFFPWRWLPLHTQSWLHDMVGDCMFIFPFPKQLSRKMNLCCYSFLSQLLFGPLPFPCLSSDIFGKRRKVVYCLFFLLRFTSNICFSSHYQGTVFFFLVNQKAHTLSSYCLWAGNPGESRNKRVGKKKHAGRGGVWVRA